jgi:hypothetical protein
VTVTNTVLIVETNIQDNFQRVNPLHGLGSTKKLLLD